ncbi:MAG: radical SAM protein [Candidatus Omnitrophota bacterium]
MKTEVAEIEYRDFSSFIDDKGCEAGMPIRGQIDLTYRCNLHCVHCYTDCYNNPRDRQKELSFEEIIRILDEVRDAGCLWLCFTGGEIFMRKDFFDIYASARKRGFIITLFTNLTLITRQIADRLAEDPPFFVETSCHGPTEEVFDAVTQVPGSFEKFVKGVRLLLERGIPVRVKTKAMTLNRGRLDDIKKLVEGFGLKFRFSTNIYPALNGSLEPCLYRLSPEEIADLETGSSEMDGEDRCAKLFDEPTERLYRCGCGTTTFHLSAWGKLGSCVFVGEPRVSLKSRSFREAVREVFSKVRGMTYQTISPCRECTLYSLCGKIPFPARFESGDAEMPVEHFCQAAHRLAEKIERGIQ